MYDRIPTPGQEGRMLISPEGGTPYYATIAMADNPTQEGTLINKATLLKDATAALFGLGAAAVPDDVHNWVGQYAKHWWSVLHGQASTGYEEARTDIDVAVGVTNGRDHSISYSKSVSIDQETGEISLVSPASFSVPGGISLAKEFEPYVAEFAAMAPVYFHVYGDSETIYHLPTGATYGMNTTSNKYTIYGMANNDENYEIVLNSAATISAQKISSQLYNIPAGATTYVNSTDRNAYPDDATEGNLTYRYLGIPFDNAVKAPEMEIGSYVGTGLYGEENPNTLTFNFAPRLVLIWRLGSVAHFFLFARGDSTYSKQTDSGSITTLSCAFNGNDLSWYAGTALNQANVSNDDYRYAAFR